MAYYSHPEVFRSNKPGLYIKMWYDSQLYAAYFLALGTTHYFPLVQMTGRAHLRENETISNWWAW